MKIIDNVEITDKLPRGVVIIKKDGKVILKIENMVVQTGRSFIREMLVLNGMPSVLTSEYAPLYTNYKLSHIAFGSSGTATQLATTSLYAEYTDLRTELALAEVDISDDGRKIAFTGKIDNTQGATGVSVQELGLFLTNENLYDTPGTNDTLFSRAVFDPIPVASGDKYEIDYYLYF